VLDLLKQQFQNDVKLEYLFHYFLRKDHARARSANFFVLVSHAFWSLFGAYLDEKTVTFGAIWER
jgi:hypothetical protein